MVILWSDSIFWAIFSLSRNVASSYLPMLSMYTYWQCSQIERKLRISFQFPIALVLSLPMTCSSGKYVLYWPSKTQFQEMLRFEPAEPNLLNLICSADRELAFNRRLQFIHMQQCRTKQTPRYIICQLPSPHRIGDKRKPLHAPTEMHYTNGRYFCFQLTNNIAIPILIAHKSSPKWLQWSRAHTNNVA